jgi:hypothetical protein
VVLLALVPRRIGVPGSGFSHPGRGSPQRLHLKVIDDGFDAWDLTGIVAGEGAGGGIRGGAGEDDDAIAHRGLDVLAGEGAFLLEFGLDLGGELLVRRCYGGPRRCGRG